jgi:hypothetical protein
MEYNLNSYLHERKRIFDYNIWFRINIIMYIGLFFVLHTHSQTNIFQISNSNEEKTSQL